jgi:hypothetical protein
MNISIEDLRSIAEQVLDSQDDEHRYDWRKTDRQIYAKGVEALLEAVDRYKHKDYLK